jgi:hypothetical protein
MLSNIKEIAKRNLRGKGDGALLIHIEHDGIVPMQSHAVAVGPFFAGYLFLKVLFGVVL